MPMRFPDEVRHCVVFLGTDEKGGNIRYRGTAVLVGIAIPGRKNWYHPYLATAAHNIRHAQQSANSLYVRYNTRDGGSEVVKTTSEWTFHPDEAVDLAVLPMEPPENYEIDLIPAESFADDELLREHNFGIGDEVVAIGLFYFRHGKKRNLPVLRTGIVASMPDESMEDEATGRPYDAYLVEMRSFGGLSGTPVFTVIHQGTLMNRPSRVFAPIVHNLALVGLIRGHWNLRSSQADFFADDVEEANSGLSIVTPAQKLTEILLLPELVRLRDEEERSLPPEVGNAEST